MELFRSIGVIAVLVGVITVIAYLASNPRRGGQPRHQISPSRVTESGGVWTVVLAPDSLRTLDNQMDTHESLQTIIDEGARMIIVDLSCLQYGFHDDAAFSPLLAAYKKLQLLGEGQMALVSPNERVRESFEFQPLLDLLPMFADQSLAEQYLASSGAGTKHQEEQQALKDDDSA